VSVLMNGADQGGGIYVENGSVSIRDATSVIANYARITGGGLSIASASASLDEDVHVIRNTPTDITCVGGSFNGGLYDSTACADCGACTSA
jgi:hypothetical protein